MNRFALLLLSFISLNGISQIPTCWYKADKIGEWKTGNHFSQDNSYLHNTEIPIAPNKLITIAISDSHTFSVTDDNGNKAVEVNIQLSDSKKYRERMITSFDYTTIKDTIKKLKIPFKQFIIRDQKIYSPMPAYVRAGECGNYIYFPENNLSVTFQFYQCYELNDEEAVKKSLQFIEAYMAWTEKCKRK